MSNITPGADRLNEYGATASLDNNPIGFRDAVGLIRANMPYDVNDYVMGQALTGASGLNVGDKWYIAGGQITNADSLGTRVPMVDVLTALPYIIGAQPLGALRVNGLAVKVSITGADSTCRIGIYESGSNLYPTRLIADSGDLDTHTATGLISATITPSVLLKPGTLYWVGLNATGTPPAILRTYVTQLYPFFGYDIQGGTMTPYFGWSVAQTYGNMPTTFPAAATMLSTPPGISWIRYA